VKQVIQNLRSGETTVIDVPVPTPRPNTALICTEASLVSAGTERMVVEFAEKSLLGKARARPDLVRQVLDKARREGILGTVQAAFTRLDQPMALGYSSAGRIVALGEGMHGFRLGQRVACAGGNYAVHAEYAVVPQNLLAPIPDALGADSAAFTTLGAIALHGFRLSQAELGSSVAVIGLGLLGMLAAQIARAAGCHVIGFDIDPQRVELAEKLQLQAVPRAQAQAAVQNLTQDRGCDAVLICADTPSADPVDLAGRIARDRAQVIAIGAVGLDLPRKIYYEKELTFINSRSYGPGRYDPAYEEDGFDYPFGYVRWTEGRNLAAFVDLLASKAVVVEPLITHRFPIHTAADAYQLITHKKKSNNQAFFLGVLLTYNQGGAVPAGEPSPVFHAAVETAGASGGEVGSPHLPRSRAGLMTIPPVDTVKLGVLGAGNFASAVMLPAIQHVHPIQPVAIVSASGLAAQHAAKRFGFKHAASDSLEVIQNDEINTVAILTRHNLHAGQVLACLNAGKHVFCEKPLALTLPDLDQIEGLISNPDHAMPLLMVGFNRRFAPLSKKLAAFWRDRYEPLVLNYRVNAGYIPLNHWVHDPAQGGGRILGEACHFIDLMTFLVGSPPISVQGYFLQDAGHYQEDNAVLTFEFNDGSIATLSYLANGDRSFSKERLEVFGSGRVAVLDDFRTLELVQDGKHDLIKSRLRQDKGYQQEWTAFTQAILKNSQPPIPYEHIFGSSRATIAALSALRTGQRVDIATLDNKAKDL